jgi:hypothetical protein
MSSSQMPVWELLAERGSEMWEIVSWVMGVMRVMGNGEMGVRGKGGKG